MTFDGGPPLGGFCVRPKKRRVMAEKGIQKAIQQAFLLQHRLNLKHMDAGGHGVKGLVAIVPQWLRDALRLPKDLPFGLEVWLHVPPGFPDLLGRSKAGRWVAIEVKRPGEKPRADQVAFLDLFRGQGAIAFWASSVESALRQFEELA